MSNVALFLKTMSVSPMYTYLVYPQVVTMALQDVALTFIYTFLITIIKTNFSHPIRCGETAAQQRWIKKCVFLKDDVRFDVYTAECAVFQCSCIFVCFTKTIFDSVITVRSLQFLCKPARHCTCLASYTHIWGLTSKWPQLTQWVVL